MLAPRRRVAAEQLVIGIMHCFVAYFMVLGRTHVCNPQLMLFIAFKDFGMYELLCDRAAINLTRVWLLIVLTQFAHLRYGPSLTHEIPGPCAVFGTRYLECLFRNFEQASSCLRLDVKARTTAFRPHDCFTMCHFPNMQITLKWSHNAFAY